MKTGLAARPATLIEQRCMWCSRTYGFKDGHGTTGVSHGVCSTCCVLCGATDRTLDEDGFCPECVLDLRLIAIVNTGGKQ